MIAHLHGVLVTKQPPTLVLDVGGVGYELEAPMSTFYDLPAVGAKLRLLTHLVVREDAHVLYGFGSEDERRLFRSLIRVSGVGAKLALTILSGISVQNFVQCVEEDDVASLIRLPGIGKKTAERLMVEMRDRISSSGITIGSGGAISPASMGSSAQREAYDALLSLGYKSAEAARMLKNINSEGQDTAEIVRQALRGPVAAGPADDNASAGKKAAKRGKGKARGAAK